jgi:hypothetical protein
MKTLMAMFGRLLRKPGNKLVRVAGAAPLAGGVMVYAIDVDGRRIIFGASPRALCVLDRYPLSDRSLSDRSNDGNPEGACAAGA